VAEARVSVLATVPTSRPNSSMPQIMYRLAKTYARAYDIAFWGHGCKMALDTQMHCVGVKTNGCAQRAWKERLAQAAK
jgi:hypothetical protein